MSWFMPDGPVIVDDEAQDAVEMMGALGNARLMGNEEAAEERQSAFGAGGEAAVRIIKQRTLGTGKFSVSISGHANPGNAHREGFSNDFISININKQTPSE